MKLTQSWKEGKTVTLKMELIIFLSLTAFYETDTHTYVYIIEQSFPNDFST